MTEPCHTRTRVLRPSRHADGSLYGYSWRCPACDRRHHVPVSGASAWRFSGDLDRPTLEPSVLVHANERTGQPLCHSFVRDGRIIFCSDSTHALAGQTVAMADFDGEATFR